MDIDKPLDDLISANRKPRAPKSGGAGAGAAAGADRAKPRVSRDRRDAAPYARPPPRSTEDKWVHDAYEGGSRRGDRRTSDRREPAPFVGASPRVEISGLHYEVTVDDLKNIFSEAGTIVQGPTIRYDRSGRSTGAATVEYASAQQAKAAINKFDGAMTKGQTITIKPIAPARPREEKGSKDGGSGSSLLARLGGGGGGKSLEARVGGRGGDRGDQRGDRERGDRERSTRGRGDASGGRGGRESRGGARGGGGGGRRGPATAEDLDKQLDGFMKPSAADGGDVPMA
ncbi:hypothetical protein VHUM_00323 [Vanrija humicola]|uniref:RRM domain-containing protein n=1 Tax=Vanrija humicola TaxID=5417 RepID=A0A7D8Z4J1_VANHU|nr:hypothetical protein VHUM_00323 [Vanrija humicola]